MFVAGVTIVVLALVITVAKEFIDKSKWSHTKKLIWTALVALVASSGAIFTVSRAISAEKRAAATAVQINRLAEETGHNGGSNVRSRDRFPVVAMARETPLKKLCRRKSLNDESPRGGSPRPDRRSG